MTLAVLAAGFLATYVLALKYRERMPLYQYWATACNTLTAVVLCVRGYNGYAALVGLFALISLYLDSRKES